MGIREKIKGIMVRQQEVIYESQLAAKKVNYHTWVEMQESKTQVVEAQNKLHVETVSEAEGTVAEGNKRETTSALIWHQAAGRLNKYALGWIEAYFAANPQVMIAYGDEDVREDGKERRNPWYKPDWSPDTYQSCFYVGSVIALRKSFAEKLNVQGILIPSQQLCKKEIAVLPEQKEFVFEKPEEIRDWLDQAIEAAGGFNKGCNSIGRVPQILYHVADESVWDAYLESEVTSIQAEGEGKASVAGIINGEMSTDSGEENTIGKKVSVIIPSRDNPQLLKQCLDSLQKSLKRQECKPEIEIVVVDNGSSPEKRRRQEELLKEHTYLYHPMEFNFAKMCNIGAEKATGSVYLFLNDDIELCDNNWLSEMLKKAVQLHAGAVGLKLYYPNSKMIQHAGITNLAVGPVHKLQGFEDLQTYYFGKNDRIQNYLAVTGACLMIEKDKFHEMGGFEESLQVAYNDVDLCMKLYEAGYQNVNVNTCFAYHHESFTRGSDESLVKQKRLQKELEILEKRHPALKGVDPYYPMQLNRDGLDARIVPGYYFAYNTKQKVDWQSWSDKIKDVREDNCVLVGIEACNEKLLQGYCVVLGDNNACYDKYLVLESVEGERVYAPLSGQYRPDLEKNLPDQKNVALGGFAISNPCKGLKTTEYKIGIMAVHRISRLKLLNWSNKIIYLSGNVE